MTKLKLPKTRQHINKKKLLALAKEIRKSTSWSEKNYWKGKPLEEKIELIREWIDKND